MTWMRNREIKCQFLFFFVFGLVLWLACKQMFTMGVWLVLGIWHFTETSLRYRKISDLSARIDHILHEEECELLYHHTEGELSILENEINKMLIRLKEQNRELKKDKKYLADSLADLSHQLRTPLTSMNIILSMLGKSDLTEQKRIELQMNLRKMTAKLQWLIDVLLKLSKLDADAVVFENQKVMLAPMIQEAAASIEIPMELKNQSLHLDIDENASFYGDSKWMVEAVGNILKNCMEHTPDNGRLSVRALENPLFTEIVIEDSGEGILPQDLSHIFERFYKGKNSSEESVGIGLALAKMIVVKQNGTIKAENRKEGGACFTIRFYKTVI